MRGFTRREQPMPSDLQAVLGRGFSAKLQVLPGWPASKMTSASSGSAATVSVAWPNRWMLQAQEHLH